MIATPPLRDARRLRHGYRYLVAGLIVLLSLLVLGDASLIGARVFLGRNEALYEGRIYPKVHALGVALGGLTREEAVAALRATADPTETALVILGDGEKQWAVCWADAGLSLDVDATAQAALAAGRNEQGLLGRLAAWFRPHEVAPVLAIDAAAARQVLERVAAQASVLPTDAALRLEREQVVAVPGVPGRMLDVDAALADLVAVVTAQDTDARVDLVFHTVAPRIVDAGPVLHQAEEILQRRIALSAYDVLTDGSFTWTLERATIVDWLRVTLPEGSTSPTLKAGPEAVSATLASLAAGLGEGRGFRLGEATDQVLRALDAGGGSISLYLTHPARVYTVQPGDVFDSIAVRFGIPPTVLAEANPGINPNWLTAGQELVVPSPDVMLPHLPVPGKRIVISISRQRMQVYENGTLRHDWPVSTGIANSPTLPGTFQVLEKVENAYASRWSLWMPHFLAVYRAGPDFHNGIHALPILAGGGRLWAGLLGRPASFGCIILGVQEAATLYQWAEVGVPVIIEP